MNILISRKPKRMNQARRDVSPMQGGYYYKVSQNGIEHNTIHHDTI